MVSPFRVVMKTKLNSLRKQPAQRLAQNATVSLLGQPHTPWRTWGKKSLSITKQINACCSSHWRHAARSHPCEKWQDCKSSPAVCSICSWASLSWACIWKHSLVFGLRDFTKFNTSLMVHMDPFLKLSVGLCKGWHVFLWPPEFPKWI